MDPSEYVSGEKYTLPLVLSTNKKKDGYKLEEIICCGKFGIVYGGIQTDLNRKIIVKFLSPNGYLVVNEFLKIMQDTDRFKTTILNSYDNGINIETNIPFLVMEGEWINFGEIVNSKDYIINYDRFFAGALQAVEYLHDRGFYHNNLRPSSFWYRIDEKLKFSNQTTPIKLADYEFCIKKPNISGKDIDLLDPEVSKIYEKWYSSKSYDINYCGMSLHTEPIKYMKHNLESLFYIFLEYCEGELPWSKYPNDEKLILKEKMEMRKPDYDYFYFVPRFMREIICFIDNMKPDEVPNNEKIWERLKEMRGWENFYDVVNETNGDKYYMHVLMLQMNKVPDRRKLDVYKRCPGVKEAADKERIEKMKRKEKSIEKKEVVTSTEKSKQKESFFVKLFKKKSKNKNKT
uniref:Protein kinase domain-containing protein n=1 Tax=Parastrongyloides trichosuri TaxID=131310 RepID=A0A0N5A789_PARTI